MAACSDDDDADTPTNETTTSQSTADEADDQAVVEAPDPLAVLEGRWEYAVLSITIETDGAVEIGGDGTCGWFLGTLIPGAGDTHTLDLTSQGETCGHTELWEVTYDEANDVLLVSRPGPGSSEPVVYTRAL